MNNANNTYLNVTMATHAGRNILFGIGKERAIYYAVQRADVKVETTGFRLRKLDIDALKQQGVDVGDKLNPLLGKLIATEAVYIEELKKLLKTDVVEKHK
ncbi:MAG: hypothetical protein ACPG4T_18170, partial [Nannocystaceae bacterium]